MVDGGEVEITFRTHIQSTTRKLVYEQMPIIENGQTVEDVYREHIRSLSPAEKISRASRLNANVWGMVQAGLREEHPDWDETALKFETARRFYWNDPKALKLLDEAEAKER